jgi:hypothetical protein
LSPTCVPTGRRIVGLGSGADYTRFYIEPSAPNLVWRNGKSGGLASVEGIEYLKKAGTKLSKVGRVSASSDGTLVNHAFANGEVWLRGTPYRDHEAGGFGSKGKNQWQPNEHIATLPEGCRPHEIRTFEAPQVHDMGAVEVHPDGRVLFKSGAPGWVSLDQVRFTPAGAGCSAP